MQFAYHSGEVSGEVYWEQVQLGGFGIGYQAFRESSFPSRLTFQWPPVMSRVRIWAEPTSLESSA